MNQLSLQLKSYIETLPAATTQALELGMETLSVEKKLNTLKEMFGLSANQYSILKDLSYAVMVGIIPLQDFEKNLKERVSNEVIQEVEIRVIAPVLEFLERVKYGTVSSSQSTEPSILDRKLQGNNASSQEHIKVDHRQKEGEREIINDPYREPLGDEDKPSS